MFSIIVAVLFAIRICGNSVHCLPKFDHFHHHICPHNHHTHGTCQGQIFTKANMFVTPPFWYVVKVVYGNLTSCPHWILAGSTCGQWRLVVKLAVRATKFHLWLNIWDCRPGCFY